MKHTINQQIFFRINGLQGIWPWLDVLMNIFAQYVIAVLWAVALVFMGYYAKSFGLYWLVFSVACTVIAIIFSYATGSVVHHPRPAVALGKQVKQQFSPLTSFKSFPSDHSIAASSLFFGTLVFASVLPGALYFLFFFGISSLLIGVSRIYAGVHYPYDILGGFAYAGITCFFFTYLIPYLY